MAQRPALATPQTGGLLLEVAAEAQGPSLVVVGLGLNTQLRGDQVQGIDQPWVDLNEILGPQGYSRNQMGAHLAEALTATMECSRSAWAIASSGASRPALPNRAP